MTLHNFLQLILPYIIFAVFAFVIMIAFAINVPFLKDIFFNIRSAFARKKIIAAKILDKDEDDDNYYLVFELKNNVLKKLQVDSYFFHYYSKGERGLLTYKDSYFIDFTRKKV